MHVSDQTLQALRDGNDVARSAYAHVDGCVRCRKILGTALPPSATRTNRVNPRIVTVATLALVALLLFAVAPLRAVAFGFVEIFEPHQLAFVPMTAAELSSIGSIPDLSDFGAGSEIRRAQTTQTTSIRTAEAFVGFHLRTPRDAASYPRTQFQLSSQALEQFVFDESKARASSADKNRAWQPMPAGMDGSVVRFAFGPTAITTYAKTAENNQTYFIRVGSRRSRSHTVLSGDGIVVAQMPVPKIGSTGISMAAIERYMIDQPGVSPKLTAAFSALRDPTTTLLLPIPVDQRYARPIFVDGVWGTGIGDETGLGGGIVWERDGFVYAVGGMSPVHDLLAIANSLR